MHLVLFTDLLRKSLTYYLLHLHAVAMIANRGIRVLGFCDRSMQTESRDRE